jgi:hypothetical protein
MQVNSSQYQNVQYLLQKTLAQTTTATQTAPGLVSAKLNNNTVVEKNGDVITMYKIGKDGQKTVQREMDANSNQGKQLIKILKLDKPTSQAATEQEEAVENAQLEARMAKASMSLVNYLA